MIKATFAAGLLAIGVFLSAASFAQSASRPTQEFVQAAAQSDQFEILEAQAVLAQSSNPAVRGFAQQMMEAHGETSRALDQAAAGAGLPPSPKTLSGDQALLLGALQSQAGPDLDRTYARHQALAHRSALVVEQGYAASGDVAALRQFAASTTVVITRHLAMTDQLQSAVGTP